MKYTNKLLLLLIILVAVVLRFINFSEIPFTHDEFSAFFRTNFNSFSELIEKGIRIDAHPAGIQVFLYYWIKYIGSSEWIVKLPFAIMGVFSVYLIYLIAKKWYNETLALITSAFMASIQYTVMYSQIARPYISGLFFVLLMVYFWTKIIKNPQKHFYLNSIFFILSAALCAYNHHFSLLFAAIAGLSGLFLIDKKYLVRYIISGVLIFVLYIPHLEIFFYQLSIGGVEGWLGKPYNDFILEYLDFLFHFSSYPIILTVVIIVFGFYKNKLKNFNWRNFILFTIWFVLPYLVGFFYSRYASAVLQFSVLIFSFPFLYFMIFGHIQAQKPLINLILVILILTVNILTLIFGRKHYDLFYKSPHKQILIDHEKAIQNNPNTLSIVDSHREITKYYLSKNVFDTNFIWFDTFGDITQFKNFLDQESKDYKHLYLGCLSSNTPLTVQIIQEYFPGIEWQKNYIGGTTYLFSKDKKEDKKIIKSLDFEENINIGWKKIDTTHFIDSLCYSGSHSYLIDSTIVYGLFFKKKLDKIIENRNNFIDISLMVKAIDDLKDILIVISMSSNGDVKYWNGIRFDTFVLGDNINDDWIPIRFSVKLSDINLDYPGIMFSTYIWNNKKKSFLIDDFKIELRDGNPFIYGLIRDFD
jgi:hypothetical protein